MMMASSTQNKQHRTAATVKSRTRHQLELVFVLKGQLDLVYKQLNYYRGACKSVDRFNRSTRGLLHHTDQHSCENSDEQLTAKVVKFGRNYRSWRKRLRKMDRELLNINLYEKIHDLYESLVAEECESIGRKDSMNSNYKGSTGGEQDKSKTAGNNEQTYVGGSIDMADPDFGKGIFITADDVEVNLDTPVELQQPPETPMLCFPADALRFFMDDISGAASDSARLAIQQQLLLANSPQPVPTNNRLYTPRKSTTRRPRQKTGVPTKHYEKAKVIKCDFEGCTFYGSCTSEMIRHKALHTDERPFQCPHCERTYKTANSLRLHKSIHEPNRSQFECSYDGCDYITHNKKYLQRHEAVHKGKPAFHCPDCGQSFHFSFSFIRHQSQCVSSKSTSQDSTPANTPLNIFDDQRNGANTTEPNASS